MICFSYWSSGMYVTSQKVEDSCIVVGSLRACMLCICCSNCKYSCVLFIHMKLTIGLITKYTQAWSFLQQFLVVQNNSFTNFWTLYMLPGPQATCSIYMAFSLGQWNTAGYGKSSYIISFGRKKSCCNINKNICY